MSEQSQGPGWWRASDGKWYAPEQALPVPPMVAPAAGDGSNLPKIIVGIVIAVALVAGGTAFALTRDSGRGGVQAFCDKAKTLHNDIDLNDAFNDPTKVDEVVAKFSQLVSAAPQEIKADMNTLNDALRSARDQVKAGKTVAFNDELSSKIETANNNVETFGTKNCGADFLLSSSSSDSSSTSIATSPSSSSSASSSSTGATGGVTDAVATRDKMLELAKAPGAADASEQPPIAEWTKAFPNLDFIGSALPASPDVVSGFSVVSSKDKDVDFLAFAVFDTHGTCAAGVLEFDSAGTTVTKSVKVNGPSQCSADAVATALGY